MPTECSKRIVRRLWEEVRNQNNLDVCDEIFDAEYAAHERGFVPVMRSAFPDLHFTVKDMIAEQAKLATRFVLTGTHQGEFLGVPATGKPMTITGTWIHRLANGRISGGQGVGRVGCPGYDAATRRCIRAWSG